MFTRNKGSGYLSKTSVYVSLLGILLLFHDPIICYLFKFITHDRLHSQAVLTSGSLLIFSSSS